MKKYATAAISVIVLMVASQAHAGTEEDLRFAEGLFKRKWYDWAEEVAVKLVESHDTPFMTKGFAAELHCTILDTRARATGDESYRKKADELRKKYKKMFPSGTPWDPSTVGRFAELQRHLRKAEELANKAELEPDREKREALMKEARKGFEELDERWCGLVSDVRKEVAKYPPEEEWWKLNKDLSKKEWERFLDKVWQRDLGEYLYAAMFVSWAKVAPEEKKKEILHRGLRKFNRFTDGDKEHENDYDFPAKGQKKPQEPSSRTSFNMLLFKAEIGKGRCYLGLGKYEQAAQSFDWMTQAELPDGLEKSEEDIARIIDIRLEAYFLEAFTYNQAENYGDAVKILTDPAVGMFSQSGRPVQPERPAMMAFWKQKKRPEVAQMPNIRENRFGKLACCELAKAYTGLGRHAEGFDAVFGLFQSEQKARSGGPVTPFEVEAAKTMAKLSGQVKGVTFTVDRAFAIGEGFCYMKRWDDAIYAYKQAYGAPGSPKQIEEYGPRILFELGKLLYDTERYWEAAIAFGEICQRFPDFIKIGQAAGMLRASARKAVEQSGKQGDRGWLNKQLYEWANKVAISPGLDWSDCQKEELRRAGDLVKDRKFEKAAEAYEGIPGYYTDKNAKGEEVKKPIPFYPDAQAQAGYCHYNVYLKNQKVSFRKARVHFDRAVKLLENALKVAEEMERLSGGITARFYLAKCLTEDMWEEKDVNKMAKRALELLEPFDKDYAKNMSAKCYLPEVLATRALAHFRLQDYDKMHTTFKELEKKFPKSQTLRVTAYKFYELMKNLGKEMEKLGGKEVAKPYFEKAGDYLGVLYTASKDDFKPKDLLPTGKDLCDAEKYREASEMLTEYLRDLPKPEDRTEEQKNNATTAKILLAEARYGMGEYKEAAKLFDKLRHTTACTKCGYESTLKPEDYDKPLKKCPKCGAGKMYKLNEGNLQILEGAGKSYLKLYETDNKNRKALDKAQDIYMRMYTKFVKAAPPLNEKEKAKLYEVLYTILKIWYYRGDYRRIVGDIKNIFVIVGGGDPDSPTEKDWEREFPIQPWRDRIREIYEKARQALKDEEARKELKKKLRKCEDALKVAEKDKDTAAEVSARMMLARGLTDRLWKDKEAKENAKKALETLEPFKDRLAGNERTKKYMPDVLGVTAMAHHRLGEFDRMHAAFLELEKQFPKSQVVKITGFRLFELMRGEAKEAQKKSDAKACFEKAGYYVYAWYKASRPELKPEHVIWAGNALYETGSFKNAAEVLAEYLRSLPKQEDRTGEQKNNAAMARILLAESKYGVGEYEEAAKMFDRLRHTTACNNCGHEGIVKPKEYDMQPEKCPKCQVGEMQKVHDGNLQIHEGAAKSYLRLYESDNKNVEALDKAQDIYERIYSRLVKSPTVSKEMKAKRYEVLYKILLIWFYKKDYRCIVELNALGPRTDEDWKREFPIEPWRTKIRELYEKAVKELEKGK